MLANPILNIHPISSQCDGNNLRVPSEIRRVDIQDASPGDSGGCGSLDVADLEHEPHGRGEGNTLVAG